MKFTVKLVDGSDAHFDASYTLEESGALTVRNESERTIFSPCGWVRLDHESESGRGAFA